MLEGPDLELESTHFWHVPQASPPSPPLRPLTTRLSTLGVASMAGDNLESPVRSPTTSTKMDTADEAAFASPPKEQTFDSSAQPTEERTSAFKASPMYRTESLAAEVARDKGIRSYHIASEERAPFPVFIGYGTWLPRTL